MDKIISIIEHYNLQDNSTLKERCKYSSKLFKEGKGLFEMRKLTFEHFNIPFDERIENLDCIYHSCYLKFKDIYKIDHDDITDRLPPSLKERWRERFQERITLIKESKMNYIEIEKHLLNKYNIHLNNIEFFHDRINCNYDCIVVLNSLHKKGRPSLPLFLKKQKDHEQREKMKEVMREKYNIIKDLKENLLSPEEFNTIKENIRDEVILKKLNFFLR